jgi:hypothetical protein
MTEALRIWLRLNSSIAETSSPDEGQIPADMLLVVNWFLRLLRRKGTLKRHLTEADSFTYRPTLRSNSIILCHSAEVETSVRPCAHTVKRSWCIPSEIGYERRSLSGMLFDS